MRVACIAVLLVSGASGEISECVAGLDGSHTCHEEIPLSDATSLLQRHNRQHESGALAAATQTGTATQTCTDGHCPCTAGEWSDWGKCSKTCGMGKRSRSRTVTQAKKHGGKEIPCDSALKASEECKLKECPVPCTKSDWSKWSACSVTCGDGTKTRSRTVDVEARHGGACDDSLEVSQKCKKKECPIHCTTSEWKEWSTCSKTCGKGKRSRSRTLLVEAKYGGCCEDALEDSQKCKEKECPVHCTPGEWSEWSKCSKACGKGTHSRSRTLVAAAKHGGKCEDALNASEECQEKECPVDCMTSEWKEWGECSATCGDGTKTRSRNVDVEEQHGGACDDPLEDSQKCKENECLVPDQPKCTMSDWKEWGECSKTCGDGTKTRSRTVTAEEQPGECCEDTSESKECKEKVCDPIEDLPTKFEVCGTVRDVIDTLNSPIPGAVVQIQGQGQTTTNTTGQFCFAEMAQGKVTLSSTKTGYVTKNMTLNISKGMGSIDVLMTKPMKMTGWRIALQWPKTPKTPLDLDSWTQLRKGSGGTGKQRDGCTVSYNDVHGKRNRSATCPSNNIKATLDQDHCYPVGEKSTCQKRTTGPPLYKKLPGGPSLVSEPETTTLEDVVPDMQCSGDDCKIVFHVTNFWQVCTHWNTKKNYPQDCGPDQDTGTLVDSQAEVTVWHGDKWKATFKIAEGDGKRQWPGHAVEEWWVFSIDVKKSTVKDCNKGGDCF